MKLQQFFKLGCTVAIAICGLTFTSCGSDNDELTSGDVKSEIKRVFAPAMDYYQTGTIDVGYYELNSESARTELRKLAAAGMISYSAERYIEKKRSYSYFYSREREIEHVFVNVALTEKGQKYVVSDEEYEKILAEIEEASMDKDLVNPNAKAEYPEDLVGAEEEIKTITDEPEPTKATQEDDPKTYEVTEVAVVTDEPVNEIAQTEINNTPVATPAPVKKTAYEQALEKVNKTSVRVNLYKMDIAKVRYIKCTPEMVERGEAKAQVILEYVDVTPFGRILRGKRDGEKESEKVSFTRYTDGWVLEK